MQAKLIRSIADIQTMFFAICALRITIYETIIPLAKRFLKQIILFNPFDALEDIGFDFGAHLFQIPYYICYFGAVGS